jgi:phospho-N-acetylmuramoyl-pentapeptide-transferase
MLGAVDDLAGIGRLRMPRALRRWRGDRGSAAAEAGIGFSAKTMFAAECAVAAALMWAWWRGGLAVPLADASGLGGLALGALIVVGTANGVNLSDGLDGLAAGLLVFAFLAQALVVQIWSQSTGVALLLVAAGGAAGGFLFYNRFPARVFMGNTASLGLGALLGATAVTTGTWPLLALVAAVFAAEAGSVLAQVGYFKATGGRRIFRMAPLHHHFEAVGWPEQRVVRRFWAAGGLAGALAVVIALTTGLGVD